MAQIDRKDLMNKINMPDDFTMESGRNNDGQQKSLKVRREAARIEQKKLVVEKRESQIDQ